MALYRCAACGSPNVMTDTQNGKLKYSYLKGAVGTALLGAGGAVVGLSQETENVFKCPDCGVVLSYPMDAKTCSMIDLGVASKKARANLPLPWESYTQKYKNIEKGYADYQISQREDILLSKATATKEEFDDAVATLVDIRNARYSKDNPMPKKVHDKGKAAVYTLIENLYRYLPRNKIQALPNQEYNGLDLGSKARFEAYFWDYLLFWNEDNFTPLPFIFGRAHRFARSPFSGSTFIRVFIEQYSDCLLTTQSRENNDSVSLGKIPSGGTLFWRQTECDDFSFNVPYAYPRFTYNNNTVQHYFEHSKFTWMADITKYIENYLSNNPDQKPLYDQLIAERKARIGRKDKYFEEKKKYEEYSEKQQALINKNLSTISSMQDEIATLNKKIFGRSRARAAAAELGIKVQELLKENTAIEQSIQNEASKLGDEPDCCLEEFDRDLFILMDFFLP